MMEDARLIQNEQSSRGGRAASLIIVAVLLILLIVVSSAGAATVKQMKVAPASLKTATATAHYQAQLSVANGTAPYSYAVESGALPEGLALSPSGLLSGTPGAAGTSTFTVRATDSSTPAQSATRTYTLTVQLDLLPRKLQMRRADEPFLEPLSAAGGEGEYRYSLASGSLPPGVEWYGGESETGLSGPAQTAGLYKFTLKVTDAAGHEGTRSYTMSVGLSIYPETIWDVRPGIVGQPYSQGLWIEGGSRNYTYSVIKGSLPEGTTLGEEEGEGIVEGTPAKSGLYRATILGTDTETGRTVTLHLKVPVFSSALPFELSHFEEEGGEAGERYVRLSPEGEGHGQIWGTAVFYTSGTFTYTLSTHQLHAVTYAEGGSVVSEYNATCEPAAHTCTGTGPHGTVTIG
jgi:hypothetical protein